MIGTTSEQSLDFRQIYSETARPFSRSKKLRVIQLGSYPSANRGARTNLLTLHDRLLSRGHESVVIDLSPYYHVKQPGVYYPRSAFELARLLFAIEADVIHLHLGSALTLRKLALAALMNQLPEAKKICTLHLGGHFYPKKGLRAWRRGATAAILRQFDSLIAVSPEISTFFERIGVEASRVHLITPFPRLRVSETVSLSDEIERFCRQHTPLIVSAGHFEPGSDLSAQFDVLSKVRERYPSAGLIAIGDGSLHFRHQYDRALHQECNHIEMPGALSDAAASELIRRANVFIRTERGYGDSFSIGEAVKAGVPIVASNNGRQLAAFGEVDAVAWQVLRALQVSRPQYEDVPAALSDGVDDVVRLYKQIAAKPSATPELAAGCEWPSIGWGL